MSCHPSSVEIAAGGLVWRGDDPEIELLLVHRPKYDDWAFPKGKLDLGEALIECAWREITEETGYRVVLGRRLPDYEYLLPGGRPKRVGFWAARCRGGEFVPNSEVDRVLWLPLTDATARLSYPDSRELLAALPPDWNQRERRLLLVRHADAGDRSRWTGEDRMRPLTDLGRIQAEALVEQLRLFEIDRIYSSPAVRCIETVRPLAEAGGMEVLVDRDLWEEASPAQIRRIPTRAVTGTTVLSTHRPVIEVVLDLLGIDRPPGTVSPKAAAWAIDFNQNQEVVDAHHLTPRA